MAPKPPQPLPTPPRPIPFPPFRTATIITFDDVADNTAVDTYYTAKGVTFASITTNPPRQWSAYARQTPSAESAPNGISVIPAPYLSMFDARNGGIQATFSSPQLYVSIDAMAVLPPEYFGQPTNKPFLQSLDANGNVLQTVFYAANYGDPAFGTWQPLVITSGSANIAKVIFSSQHSSGPAVYALFDRLAFAPSIPIFLLGP
jgi:hypothetical protein